MYDRLYIDAFLLFVDIDRILLRIRIPNVNVGDTKLEVDPDRFVFEFNTYFMEFAFRHRVKKETVRYRSTQRDLTLVIEKEKVNSYWEHLMVKEDKIKFKVWFFGNECSFDIFSDLS